MNDNLTHIELYYIGLMHFLAGDIHDIAQINPSEQNVRLY